MAIKDIVVNWGLVMVGVLMNVLGIYFVKVRMNVLGEIKLESLRVILEYFLTLAKSPLAVIGGILIILAPFPYAAAVSRMQLSVVYPVSIALNFLLIVPLGIFFLGEGVTINKLIALALILVSLYLLHK